MDFGRMLAELFAEEDKARDMAHRLMDAAKTSQEAASAERASLAEFLAGPMERHMEHEERAIFPQLEARGLGAEVQVACKQHEAVREAARQLAALGPHDDCAELVFDTGKLLLHHTNFEGDYIYPELDRDAWLDLMRETTR
jgi:DUF438 domain-containing protein